MAKTVRKTGDDILANPSEIDEMMRDVFAINEEIAVLNASIKQLKERRQPYDDYFDKLLPAGGNVKGKFGEVLKKISNSYSVIPEKLPVLQKLFGDMIDDFVQEKRTYGLTAALRKIVNDDKHKNHDKVTKAVEVKASTSIEYKEL